MQQQPIYFQCTSAACAAAQSCGLYRKHGPIRLSLKVRQIKMEITASCRLCSHLLSKLSWMKPGVSCKVKGRVTQTMLYYLPCLDALSLPPRYVRTPCSEVLKHIMKQSGKRLVLTNYRSAKATCICCKPALQSRSLHTLPGHYTAYDLHLHTSCTREQTSGMCLHYRLPHIMASMHCMLSMGCNNLFSTCSCLDQHLLIP